MPKGERQEVSVLTATIPPGGKTPFHTHRFPGTVYIFRRHLHSRTIERAKGLPSVETLDVIASKLDIPIGDFFPRLPDDGHGASSKRLALLRLNELGRLLSDRDLDCGPAAHTMTSWNVATIA